MNYLLQTPLIIRFAIDTILVENVLLWHVLIYCCHIILVFRNHVQKDGAFTLEGASKVICKKYIFCS